MRADNECIICWEGCVTTQLACVNSHNVVICHSCAHQIRGKPCPVCRTVPDHCVEVATFYEGGPCSECYWCCCLCYVPCVIGSLFTLAMLTDNSLYMWQMLIGMMVVLIIALAKVRMRCRLTN